MFESIFGEFCFWVQKKIKTKVFVKLEHVVMPWSITSADPKDFHKLRLLYTLSAFLTFSVSFALHNDTLLITFPWTQNL